MTDTYNAENVTSRADFVRFVEALLADWRAGDSAQRETASSPSGPAAAGWENPTLDRFLEALATYTADAALPDPPSWHTFARILAAATVYE